VTGNFVLDLLGTQSTREESMIDRTASAGFEGIAQMLLEQKKLMDALEAENRELRRQLADLRRGVGIAVVIEGKTIQLATEPGSSMSGQSQAALQSLQGLQNTPAPVLSQSSPNSYTSQNGRSTNSQSTIAEKRDNNNVRSPLADSFVL
jgi:hypothetical protein